MTHDWLRELLIKFSFLKKFTSLPSLVNHLQNIEVVNFLFSSFSLFVKTA
jgi:hypothetical protein